MSRQALIIGAGIGGLAAAVALRAAGWNVRVLERAQTPREPGFALLLAPNAMAALRALGVADAVVQGGAVATQAEVRRPDGTVLKRIDLAPIQAKLGEPTVCALRPVVHGALLAALSEDVLELGVEARGVELGDGFVRLHLADGSVRTGDVLVGADGVRSAIRASLHPDDPPPWPSGLAAFRGVARGVTGVLGEATGAQYLGTGCEAGVSRAAPDTVYWYVCMRTPPANRRAALDRVLEGFHASFSAIVEATDPSDLRYDELFERAPLRAWGRGRATLLGDAAHPMLPHAGQGAAQALEDAVVLGRALASAPDVERALRHYEAERSARTRKIVALARRNARAASIESPWVCALRDAVVRVLPGSVMAKSMVDVGRPSFMR